MSSPSVAPGARRKRLGRWATLGPATAVMVIIMVLPLLLMMLYSFWHFVPSQITDYKFTLENYGRLFSDGFYLAVTGETMQLGLIVTVLTLVISYPLAYYLARTTSPLKGLLTYLIFVPMMVGIVVRAYGWIVILGAEGLVNSTLMALHLVSQPLELLYTPSAVILGLVQVLLPFFVMPLISAIEKIDVRAEEAARALGATRVQTFLRVTLPLSRPGIVSGALLVFSLSITSYALPALLGGAKVKVISALAYDAMLVGSNYPFGSAIGMFMVVVATAVVFAYLRISGQGLGGAER